MKKTLVGFVCLLIGLALFTSSSLASHEIAYFRDNKKGAVSLTFDDGYQSQLTTAVPLLNARVLKGTFFAITMSGWIDSHVSWETYRNVASQGYEIGSHTVNHPDLTTLPESDMKWELSESQSMINDNIPSQEAIFAVNCGGQEYTDKAGIVYQADTLFSGGRTRVTRAAIEGTEDDVLYQSERYGNFSYSIPISNGNYMVTLKFAETFYSYNTTGKRIFDVWIEGVEVVSNLDLFAQVGKNKAYDVTIPVSVTDGTLNIDFITNVGNATVSAIIVSTPSKSCVLFAYPYGNSNAQVQNAASNYYIAARGTWAPEGGFLNYYENGPTWEAVNFFNIGSYGIYESTTIADLDYYLNLAEQRHAWFTVHFYEVTNTDFFAQFLDHLLTKNVWVDTFGAIVRYMQERLFSTLTVISESSSEIRLSLSHSLDNSIFNLPLTIRSTVPSSWKAVKVQQGDSFSIVAPVKEGEETVIYYNAFPNQGEIVLSDGTQRFIYVANNPSNRIDSNDYIILKDIISGEIKSFLYTYDKEMNPSGWANPEGMTFLGNRLFITGSISMKDKVSTIWEIDPNTGQEISSFSTGSGWSRGLASDGTNLFVSQYSGSDYKIYKFTTSGELIDSFKVPANMSGLAYGRGYLFGASRNKVYRIDPNSKTVVTTFSLPWKNITGLDFIDGPNPYLLVTALFSKIVYRVELDDDLNFNGITETFCTVPGFYSRSVVLFP